MKDKGRTHLGVFDNLHQLLAEHMDYHVQVPLVLLLVVDHLFDDLLVGHAGRRSRGRRVRSIVAVALVEHVHQQLKGECREELLVVTGGYEN